MPASKLWLHLLGGAEAGIDPETPLVTSGKALALLAFLSCAPKRRAERERLLDLIWADLDRPNARGALRSAIHWLKRRCGQDIFVAEGDSLILDPSVSSDRDAFLAAIDADDLPTALSIYAGDFLPRFAAPGAREFEEWADSERLRLKRLFVHAADRQCRLLLSGGNTREAIALAKRARDADADAESAWRLYLEALIAGRDSVLAAAEADALERLLAEDERDPEPATRALLRVARQPTGASPEADAKVALHAELVGRATEFATIMSAWEAARTGTPRHLHLAAPPGLGKSRLLDDIAARLRASRARLVTARAQPGERSVGYAFVAEIAKALAALPGAAGISAESASALVALNPALSSTYSAPRDDTSGDDALRRRAVAIGELLDAVADEVPIAVLLDDLHWADGPSLQVLQSVLGRLATQRLLLVTTSRPSVRPAAHERLTVLQLSPLTVEQVGALISSLATLPAEQWAQSLAARLYEASGGTPLQVISALQDLVDRGLLSRNPESGWSTTSADDLVAALAEGAIQRRRIEHLDRAERWVLLLLGVAEVPLAVEHVVEAARQPEGQTQAALQALESRGLITAIGNGTIVQPAHDLIAEDVRAASTPEALKAAHAAIGRLFSTTLSRVSGVLQQSGMHLLRAGDRQQLTRAFQTLTAQRRRSGIRATPQTTARELLGSDWTPEREAELLRSLPWRERPFLRQVAFVATAIVMFIFGAAAVTVRSSSDEQSDAYLIQPYGPSAARTVYKLPKDVFEESGPLVLSSLATVPVYWPDSVSPSELAPSGRELLGSINIPGPNTTELVAWSADSGTRLLSPSVRDDGGGFRSPDDSLVAFPTARWSPARHFYKVGILNVRTGATRQLSPADSLARDVPLGWTPDGTTFLFARIAMTEAANQVCRVGRDGGDLDCVDTPGRTAVVEGAVVDAFRASLVMADGNEFWLARLDWRTRMYQRVADVSATTSLSSDGRVALCFRCTADGRTQLIRVSSEELRRDVVVPSDRLWIQAAFIEAYPYRGRTVGSLSASFGSVPLSVGERRDIRLDARAADGQGVELARARYVARDPSIVAVDPSGAVLGLRTGRTWVLVDAYGLARDSVLVTVAATTPRLIAELRRVADVERMFTLFGDPKPSARLGQSGLLEIDLPNDDPSYISGLMSRGSFDPSAGLFAEADIVVPNTRYQWQLASLAFASIDSAGWANWNKRDAAPRVSVAACVASFPAGEGYTSAYRAAVGTETDTRVVDVASERKTARHRFHVSILPDGRCAVAIDNVPVYVGRSTITSGRLHVDIRLKSYDTRVVVSNVSIWRGVKPDFDWSRVPSRSR